MCVHIDRYVYTLDKEVLLRAASGSVPGISVGAMPCRADRFVVHAPCSVPVTGEDDDQFQNFLAARMRRRSSCFRKVQTLGRMSAQFHKCQQHMQGTNISSCQMSLRVNKGGQKHQLVHVMGRCSHHSASDNICVSHDKQPSLKGCIKYIRSIQG